MYEIFLRCILSFKTQRYVSDSCLPHFLSVLDRRFVFPLQPVTDAAFTSYVQQQQTVECFIWFISYIRFRELKVSEAG